MVSKVDVFEGDGTATEIKWSCIGFVLHRTWWLSVIVCQPTSDGDNLWRLVLRREVEQDLHVKKALSHLAIDGAEEVERKRQLEDQLVHHDEVTNSHSTYARYQQTYR